MPIGILHLSDIHFNDEEPNPVLDRTKQIADAFLSRLHEVAVPIVVVTGDIAFHGRADEYDLARRFLDELIADIAIGKQLGREAIPLILIPGNHDCDFTTEHSVRRNLVARLDDLARDASQDTSTMQGLTSIQQQYFDFAQALSPAGTGNPLYRNLTWAIDLSPFKNPVTFFCYNTAWVSQKKEKQGKLVFPLDAVPPSDTPNQLVVSIFHHPYNWLEASSSRKFRRAVEETSDVVLTGHEHDSEVYTRRSRDQFATQYVEGDVLQVGGSDHSGFNVVQIELEDQRWQAAGFIWRESDGLYAPEEDSIWNQLERSKRVRLNFEVTSEFAAHLGDPGANFTHPRKHRPTLRDLFVYPDVDVTRPAKREVTEFVSGQSLLNLVLEEHLCLFLGAPRSGKTALSKMFFSDLSSAGKVALLLPSSAIRDSSPGSLDKVIREAAKEQYGKAHEERFSQLAPESKVLIIDDFNRVPLNAASRETLAGHLLKRAETVILFADQSVEFDTALGGEDLGFLSKGFRFCRIRELGHFRREHLIRRWLTLGAEETYEEDDTTFRVTEVGRTINTVLGRRLLPSHPIFVLTLLQILEAGQTPKTVTGSFGYIYETLIASALAKFGGTETIDTKFTYLNRLAYRMYKDGVRSLSEDASAEIASRYFEEYKVRMSTKMSSELLDSHILIGTPKGIEFRYSYLYYFFVAKYLQENIHDNEDSAEIRHDLSELSSRLYNEDAANILMFYVYLTKDTVLIRQIVENAQNILAGEAQCDFKDDVQFVTVSSGAPKLVYVETAKPAVRERYLKRLDDAEERDKKKQLAASAQSEEGANDVQSLGGQLNAGMKTLAVVGQILRNFPGSLRGEVKEQMARESYKLGLRILGVACRRMAPVAEFARTRLNQGEGKLLGSGTKEEREQRLNRFFVYIGTLLGFGTIKSVSQAVGSGQLKEIYKGLIEADTSIGFSLIDLSVRLDHLRPFPEELLFRLYKQSRGNEYVRSLIRAFALEYMYLYPCKQTVIQKVCTNLGIEQKKTHLIDPRYKL